MVSRLRMARASSPSSSPAPAPMMCAPTMMSFLPANTSLIKPVGAFSAAKGRLHDADVLMLRLCFVWGQPDVRNLRVGKSTPRDNMVVHLLFANSKQRVAHRFTCLVGGNVGEKIAADDITDGEDIAR